MLLLSVLVYCCRPTSCVFPSWLVRTSTLSHFLPLSLSPFSPPFPLSQFHHSHTHTLTSHELHNQKNHHQPNVPHHSFMASLTHILSRNIIITLFLFILSLHSTLIPFFFPSNHNMLPISFFFSLSGAINFFMLSFYIVAYQSFSFSL